MANSQQTEEKQESLWTLATALTFILGVLAVAMVLDYSGIYLSKPSHGAVIHDQAFKSALANFDLEMSRSRPELFGSFGDGDVRIQNCLGYLTATVRPDRLSFFSEIGGAHDYSDCLPLRAAYQSREPEFHLAPEASLGRVLAEWLDPSALKALLPEWIGQVRRLRDAGADETVIAAHSVTLRHGEDLLGIEVLASADIAGKDVEDLIVRITGSGTPRYVILTQDEGGALRPMAEQTLMALTQPANLMTD
jgi:hypothetical protein